MLDVGVGMVWDDDRSMLPSSCGECSHKLGHRQLHNRSYCSASAHHIVAAAVTIVPSEAAGAVQPAVAAAEAVAAASSRQQQLQS